MNDWISETRDATDDKADVTLGHSAAQIRTNSISAVCGTLSGDAGEVRTIAAPTTTAGTTTTAVPPPIQTAIPVWREDVLGARQSVLIALGRRAAWTIADLKLRLKPLTGLSLHQQSKRLFSKGIRSLSTFITRNFTNAMQPQPSQQQQLPVQSEPKAQNHQQIYEESIPPPEYEPMNFERSDTITLVTPPLFITSSVSTAVDHYDDSSAFSISSASSGGSDDSTTSFDINDAIEYVSRVAQTQQLSTPNLNSGSGVKRNWVTNDNNNDDLDFECNCSSDDYDESKTLDPSAKEKEFFNKIGHAGTAAESSYDSTVDDQYDLEA
ncbi:hypothetical protein HK100_002265, partial [Physocladia obscura]